MAVIREAKLSQEESTPQIPGFDSVCRNRDGSGTRLHQGRWFDGLHLLGRSVVCTIRCNHQPKGTSKGHYPHYYEMSIFHYKRLPPPTSFWLLSNHQNDQSCLVYLPKEPDLICGDFNAHDCSWDHYVSTDARGSALCNWIEAHSKVVLSDGSPTSVARGEQSGGMSTPDLSLVDTLMAGRFSWETIPELGSEHLPLFLIWYKDIKVERVHTRRRPNYPKADWPLFHKCLDDGMHAVLSVGSLSKSLEAFCNLLERAESEAVPIKMVRKREIPRMNAQLK